MRRMILCLSLCAFAGCSGGDPTPSDAPLPVVTNDSLKALLEGIEKSGTAGSGIQQLQMGVEKSGKPELNADLEALTKADSQGQSSKVKQLAAKMLKSL